MDFSVMQLISNILSMITIFSCLFLKVPQIVYIREKKSAAGIYIQAMLMEITGFTIVTLYNYTNNYSLLTYMEYPIILVQIYVMLYYVLLYKQLLRSQLVPMLVGLYALLIFAFVTELLPKYLLSFVLPLCTPLSGFAKVTYMFGIVRARNADAVSPTTWLISVATNLARLFTVYVDSADPTLMCNFVISAMLSAGVLGTALYYQRAASTPPASPAARKLSGGGAHRRRRSRAYRDYSD